MGISEGARFKLKPKQMKALKLLAAQGKTQSEAARIAGVSEMTLYNWMHFDNEFRRAYDELRRDIYRSMAPRAVRKLISLMEEANKEELQLKVAEKFISLAGDDVQKPEICDIKINVSIADDEK